MCVLWKVKEEVKIEEENIQKPSTSKCDKDINIKEEHEQEESTTISEKKPSLLMPLCDYGSSSSDSDWE